MADTATELAARVGGLLSDGALMASSSSASWALHIVAHDSQIPILRLSLDKRIARHLPPEPLAKLERLQAAATSAGFELAHGGTRLCRSLPPGDESRPLAPRVGDGVLTMLRIPADRTALPAVEGLPARVDYLHHLAEVLGVATVCPFSLRGGRGGGGQRSEQPLLYVGVAVGGGPDTRPVNDMASALAGCEVRGDAVITSAEFRESGELECSEPCGVGALVAALTEQSGEPAGFVAAKHGRPLLASWTVPRTAAFEPHPPPKAVLNEYLQAHPQEDITHLTKKQRIELRDFPPDRPEGVPPRGFTGHVTLNWPAGEEAPLGAKKGADGVTIELETQPQPRKSTKKDTSLAAEDVASELVLDALQRRTALTAGRAGASAALAFTPPLRFVELRKPPPASPDRELHPAGTRLDVSYALAPLAPGAEPPAELAVARKLGADAAPAVAAPDADGAWERCVHGSVLLGSGVMQREVEELLSEMGAGEACTAYGRATLLRRGECWVSLEVVVHAAEPPSEEKPMQKMYDAMGAVGRMSHGEERLAFVVDAIRSWGDCTSVADVGCGEGKLLERLVRSGGGPPRLVGITKEANALRRAERKVVAAAAEAGAAAPSVTLLRGEIAQLDVAADALVLIEVIEHLEPNDLELVGTKLLGELAPRRMLVTTPNIEYNLNFMKMPESMQKDAAGLYVGIPPVSSYTFRNPDHRFEWTRAEFSEWASRLAAAHGYTVSFGGVGGGAFDEKVPHGEWRGAGPQTQLAIFERADAPPAQLGLEATRMEVVWSSAS